MSHLREPMRIVNEDVELAFVSTSMSKGVEEEGEPGFLDILLTGRLLRAMRARLNIASRMIKEAETLSFCNMLILQSSTIIRALPTSFLAQARLFHLIILFSSGRPVLLLPITT